MNGSINIIFKKYLLAAVIAIVGLVLLIYGLNEKNGQDSLFIVASANIFVGGVLAVLLSSGLLKRNLVIVLAVLCTVVTCLIGYFSYESVNDSILHNEKRVAAELQTVQVLTEIKELEKAFKEQNGRYAANFDELKNFFETGTVKKVESEGTVPQYKLKKAEKMLLYNANPPSDENMTELEAYRLKYEFNNPTNIPGLDNFRRDTVEISFKESFLNNKSMKANRARFNMGPFDIEEIRYVPLSEPRYEWTIQTIDSAIVIQDTMPVIRVYAEEPISKFEGGTKDTIGFGNLKTGSLTGTWE
ncbi:hypothetical protein SAMN05216474_1247 [Lishizhenia tianjinensis]|uniref:Uncharacterized protein n=1 Tax=Lishizhenia tianjinensis TaxID=477690 RepID=A0A1I6YWR9_9FLAO|nr:hypothetical protein [Lishizhenia tianjinensis]SFT54889.1 hypothetical protein SAMN05216474_1247 [Lishizhenia tianjinensis]